MSREDATKVILQVKIKSRQSMYKTLSHHATEENEIRIPFSSVPNMRQSMSKRHKKILGHFRGRQWLSCQSNLEPRLLCFYFPPRVRLSLRKGYPYSLRSFRKIRVALSMLMWLFFPSETPKREGCPFLS